MAFSSSCRRLVNGSSSLIASRISNSHIRSKHFKSRSHNVSSERGLRQFVSSKGKSAGRNSAGRITIFHRGGAAKRLQRTIDLKRNTPSMGVVERIEYDPNRTSRIAIVRWEPGRQTQTDTIQHLPPSRKPYDPNSTPVKGLFAFSSLPGMVEKRTVVGSAKPVADHGVVGLPKGTVSKSPFTSKPESKMASPKDVFLSAFSSPKGKQDNERALYSFVSSLGLPRMAIAGARPDFFVPKTKTDTETNENPSLNEIKKWEKESISWALKIKHKAAVSWQSLRRQETLGLPGVAEHEPKPINKEKKDGKFTVDRTPVTYVIATHKMAPGNVVMSYDSS